jgi:hypothetical protein
MDAIEKKDRDVEEIGRTLFAKYVRFDVIHSPDVSDVTLKLEIMSRSVTRTIREATFLDPVRVETTWAEMFMEYDKYFPVGNVPADNNNEIPGGFMTKEESIAKFHSTVEAQQTAAIGQVFDDGKAGGGAGFTKEDIDKAVADAIAALPADTTPFDQAYVSAAVSKAVSEALAALPADQTPFSKEDLDKAVSDAVAAVPKDEEMAKQLGELKAENSVLKLAIQAEIDDSKVDTSRLEKVLAPVLSPVEPTV